MNDSNANLTHRSFIGAQVGWGEEGFSYSVRDQSGNVKVPVV